MVRTGAPTPSVLMAFGLQAEARRLPGGAGGSWVVGDAVLKRGCDVHVQEWLGTDVAGVVQDGFRLPGVLRALDGRWVVDGWGAAEHVAGVSSETGRVGWVEVVQTGRALHRALRHLPRPGWLSSRDDPWARADAAAWGETGVEVVPALRSVVERLYPLLGPLGPDQLVHGDLTGNVLVAPGRPPVVIDLSPYWRPTAYAEGVVVADAMCWHGATLALADAAGVSRGAVARGLLFRVLTTNEAQRQRPDARTLALEAAAYAGVIGELSS